MIELEYCINCGEELSENANYCHKCGVITEIGKKKGLKRNFNSEIEKSLHLASINIEEGLSKVSGIIKEASEEMDPKFEVARESLQSILEEIKEELRKKQR